MTRLLDQLTFYGSYHREWRNKAIHFVCVPLIAWSVLVWCCGLRDVVEIEKNEIAELPDWLSQNVPTAPATLVVVAYFIYYVSLDQFAGVTWLLCVGAPLRLTAKLFTSYVGDDTVWKGALAAHVTGWGLQIYPGHLVFEKRRPAVMDSAFQSLVLAPLFVWMELLFTCGYRPGLREDLKRRVDKAVVELDGGKNTS